MNEEKGGVNIWNPDKGLSVEITLKNMVAHDMAMDLARRGIPQGPLEKPLTFNERVLQRFKGLNEMISIQQSIISNNKAIVKVNCIEKWKKKYKEEEEQKNNPFDEEDNDYNELLAILSFLDSCEQKIITSRKSNTFKDDFIWEKQSNNDAGKVFELSPNFFTMLKDLEDSYEGIHSILIYNKIVSSGLSTNEDVSETEKEAELVRRILNA